MKMTRDFNHDSHNERGFLRCMSDTVVAFAKVI